MATPEDIENRLAAVERDLAEVRRRADLAVTDAAAARTLAAGADRDVSEVRAELRAHTSALNALRETQVDFAHRLTALEGRLDSLERTVQEGFTMLHAGMDKIVNLLEAR